MPDTNIGSRSIGFHETVSVDDARGRILTAIEPLPAVEVPLHDALGLTLAGDIAAKGDLPPFANSAMDGYALRSSDTVGVADGTPVELRVTGQVAAGDRADIVIEPGCAVRIMTGAQVPPSADAVVRFEHTEERSREASADSIVLQRPVTAGENIRPAGEDALEGTIVLQAGTRVRPAMIGLMAAAGHATARVHRRPRVAVLVTGDEIVAPGESLGPGQIWNSNGPMVEAHIRQYGGNPVMLNVASDTPDAVRSTMRDLAGIDLLITTGGVSVGDFDVVKDVLQAEGRIHLWSLRIKPGKPLAFGRVGKIPVIGLPGNPVAAAVAFLQFARPAILTMLGRRDVTLTEIEARVLDRIENRGGRRQFVRVRVEQTSSGYVASLSGGQGSAMLTSLAAANGLLVIPETCAVAEPGSTMTVQMLDQAFGEFRTTAEGDL